VIDLARVEANKLSICACFNLRSRRGVDFDSHPYTQPNGIRFGIYFRRAAAGRLAARIRRR
jgi:hypothetical protein